MSKTACSHAQLISRLSRTTSSPAGLDGGLQLIQYGSPLVAAALLALLRLRREHPILAKLGTGDGSRLAEVAAGVLRASASVGEARVITRTFGMLPMIDWLLKLHPNPLRSLLNLIRRPSFSSLDISNERIYGTVRVLLLMGFYIGEHAAWLGSKGILRMTPEQCATATKWSIRSWTVDVFLAAAKMVHSYGVLQARTRQLSAARSEEKVDTEASAKLADDWATWKQQAMVTFGWLPLTLHWNLGGLWENPLITAAIGTFVAQGKLRGAWRAVA